MSGADRGSRIGNRIGAGLALVAGLGLAATGAVALDVGRVVALAGSARVEGPDGSRALACGDTVQAGELVVVADDGRVGVLSDAVYAQLESASRLRADVSEQGLPDWSLEAGRVRLVDTRGATTGGPPLGLATPNAEASGKGGDREAYVFAEKAGVYSVVCEWGAPLSVARNGDAILAEPGECAIAKSGEPIYIARAQDERIPLAGPDACVLAPALPPVASRFSPTDVASPPPPGSLLPPAPPTFARTPCEVPGSGCMGSLGLPGLGVIEDGPGPGTLPPGIGAVGPGPGPGTLP